MPTRHTVRIPPPKGWEELEILVWDLFRCMWKDPYATRHGRSGQRQNGVDIYGHPDRGSEIEGVQVKGRDSEFGGAVTEAELRAEAEKATSFEPKLKHLTLVTSAQRDAAIQQVARALTQENSIDGLFGVDVWGWEDVEERLAGLPDLMQMHYPQFQVAGDSDSTTLLQSILRGQQEEAEHTLVQNRPRFEVTSSSVTNTESRFIPGFKCKQISGDSVASLEWAFRGPRFQMETRQLQGSQLERVTLQWEFDLSGPPAHDDLVDPDQMGLELRFYWRGGWRRELHRWPITRKELPAKVHWDVGREILPPLELDGNA